MTLRNIRNIGVRSLSLALAACMVVAIGYLVRNRAFFSPEQLLARAYTEQRSLELRICRTPYSLLRVRRGDETSRMDRSQSLLEAEALIAKGLRNHPEDSSLLAARGQANLLEGAYEAAITDMQETLDAQPKSAAILNGLATAYFERAESGDRFDDYAIAFELQSRALEQSPDDPVILFNRAITSARLCLYKQSIEDWRRYLFVDASGDWSDEARNRLREIQGILDAHDQRTKNPLLTPAEFVQKVSVSDPETWDAVEPRIEEYLSAAIKEWLPMSFPLTGASAGSGQATRALWTLALILKERHADQWLSDLLCAPASQSFAQAIDALKRAVIADNADYALGRKEAVKAAQLFFIAGSRAGQIRARFEAMYATRLSDAGPECLNQLAQLAPAIEKSEYSRLQIQVRLERYNCSSEEGDFQRSDQLVAAYKGARFARYTALELRLLSTLAVDDLFKGRRNSGAMRCRDGLRQYWSGSVTSYLGRTFYSAAGFEFQRDELWHAARAAADQELTIATPGEDPLSLAIEHAELARASLMANDPVAAHDNLKAAQSALASTVHTEATENYRLTVESYSALVDGESGQPEAGLARLERMRTQLTKIANTNVLADFYRIAGELQGLAGHPDNAEKDLANAVALGEKMRRSLRSESDQLSWMREWAKPYLDLVEVEFQMGRPSEALDIWELYRDPNSTGFPRSAGYTASSRTEVETAVASMRLALTQESERLRRTLLQLDDQTLLVLGLTPHGVAIWAYDNRGMTAKWLQKSPADLRLETTRLAELCSQSSSSLEEIRATARQLYKVLIEPASDQLRSSQTIIIQTDESLSAVPFQVLVDGAGKYLEDDHPVSYLPVLSYPNSRSLPAHINSDASALVVASAGGSGDGLRPLANAVIEARAVVHHFPRGRLLEGAEATLSTIGRQLSQAEIFHFSGHAYGGGGRSGLLLNAEDGSRKPGLFDANALRKIALAKMQLAVLSACSTENGGEGLPGDFDSLARVMLSQGVPHMLATRWNVDSDSSASLMGWFYDSLLDGSSAPRALAAAEAALRQKAPHPYYWAAFDAFGQN
jgi:CHAT domain-containing protein